MRCPIGRFKASQSRMTELSVPSPTCILRNNAFNSKQKVGDKQATESGCLWSIDSNIGPVGNPVGTHFCMRRERKKTIKVRDNNSCSPCSIY